MKSLFVQWGAGNIGRSFIGQVFARKGYQVIFIDIDKKLIEALNQHGQYMVETVSREGIRQLPITGISACDAGDQQAVNDAITQATLMGVSVGKNVWPFIAKQLAQAIYARYTVHPGTPLDIILAENIHHAATFVKDLLTLYLPSDFPFSSYVGLVETSIGKMVPIQTTNTPLVLRAEPYNELIVDKNGFLNAIPSLDDLHPVSPISAYVDRKLFIHNLGHATAAYLGFQKYPEKPLIADVLEDSEVVAQVRHTMMQSMEVLLHTYPKVWKKKELEDHVDDLIFRFGNRALGDTVFRVGRDLLRKLRYDDRLMGIIIQAQQAGKPWDWIGKSYLAALSFTARDGNNEFWPADQQFIESIKGLSRREIIYIASGWKDSNLAPELFEKIADAFELIE